MKVSVALALFLSALVPTVTAQIPPATSDSLTSEFTFDGADSQLLPTEQAVVYSRPFAAYGPLFGRALCGFVDRFCDDIAASPASAGGSAFNGATFSAGATTSMVACLAAQSAMSNFRASFGAAGVVTVSANNGNIQSVSLVSQANAAVVAATFSTSTANNSLQRGFTVAAASANAARAQGFPFAATRAASMGLGSAEGAAFASASSTTGSSTASSSATFNAIQVRGASIQRMRAVVSVAASGFSQSNSQSSARSLVDLATEAFALAVARVCPPHVCSDSEVTRGVAATWSQQFSNAMSRALSRVTVRFSFTVSVTDNGDFVNIQVVRDGDIKGQAGTSCAGNA